MMDDLKNILLAGLGSAAYTYEKASSLLEDLVEKGRLSMEEGKELSKELKRTIVEKEEKIRPLTKEDMAVLLREMNFATKEDLDNINTRLTMLEQKFQ